MLYANVTSGRRALDQTTNMLRDLGCAKFGTAEDVERGTITLAFEFQGRACSIEVNTARYADLWLEANPWSPRRALLRKDWERKAREKAALAAFSILRDWVKAQITVLQLGALDFDSVFLAHIVTPRGKVLDVVRQEPGERPLLPPPDGFDAGH